MSRDFPNYAELVTSRPLALADAQDLLAEDEALIVYAVQAEGTLLWVVRGQRALMYPIAIGGEDLKKSVQTLHAGADDGARRSALRSSVLLGTLRDRR